MTEYPEREMTWRDVNEAWLHVTGRTFDGQPLKEEDPMSDKPNDRPIPTPGAGFYDPKKETPQRLVEEGRAPKPQPAPDRITDNLVGENVAPPAPGDRITQ